MKIKSPKMIVELLGTGTSQGIPVILCDCEVCKSKNKKDNRLRCSISVRHGATNIIVDVGPDFRQQMLRTSINHVDAVLLTHEHNDHIIGLDDLRPYNFHQSMNIPLYLSSRVSKDVKTKFHYAFSENAYPGAPRYELKEIKHGDRWNLGGIEVTSFEVMHGNLPILCFRFNDFVYITDAKIIEEKSLEIIRGCDTLVVNALRNREHWSHFTLNEALEFISMVNPKKAYLTHVSHLLGLHDEIERNLPQNVHLCYDGMIIEIS